MERVAFQMRLKPGAAAEYRRRHDVPWPELAAKLPDSPVVRKWWAYMASLLEMHPDGAPAVTPLREVFHLE